MEEATSRVLALEAEIETLQQHHANQSHPIPEISDTPPHDYQKSSRWWWF